MTPEEKQQLERQLLFTPCKTKEELGDWIDHMLGYRLPDCIVDADSNSSPLDLVWEIYHEALYVNNPNFEKILAYANRFGAKTLGASALELLMVFHDQRDVVHLAAIEEQSTDCLNYVKKALRNPVMAPFEVQGDKRAITIQVFKKDGKYYSPKEYEKIPDVEKFGFQEYFNKIEVIVATPKSLNGKHGAFFCIDENTPLLIADKTRSRKSRSAKFVFNTIAGLPVTGRRGRLPIEDLDISNPQKDIELLTFNFSTGSLEPKKILRGHRKRAQTINIVAGKRSLICTLDHPIFVFGKGFTEAGAVSLGDKILAIGKGGWGNRQFLSKEIQNKDSIIRDPGDLFEQVVLGSLLGDGSCLKHTRSKNAYFSERHCIEQAEYLNWKRQIIGQQVKTSECKNIASGYTGNPQAGFYTQNSHIFNQWLGFKQNFQNLEKISPIGLAVWYMDDGYAKGFSIASHGFTKNQNERLVEILWNKFQIKARVAREVKKDGRSYWYITGGLDAKKRLVEICRPYIHPQMAFKFDIESHSKQCVACGHKFWPHQQGPSSKTCGQAVCLSVLAGTFEAVSVDRIEPAGERTVYDFTVENNHNFFSGQILSHNCMDETDLLDNESIVQEADGVPTPTKDRRAKHPIVYMTSTRKKAAGRVQKLIDRAEQEDIRVRHWNLIDITKPCPPEKHQPNEPKVSMYVDDNALKAIPEESYEQLNEGDRLKYQKHEMFQGCKSCPLAATCKSRLATHQKSSNSTLLLDHAFTTKKVTKGNIEFIKSQFLCRKPLSTGSIFSRFSRERHLLSAAEIYEKLEQQEAPANFNKQSLVKYLKAHPLAKFYGGIDFGYTHMFVAIVAAKVGLHWFVLDCLMATELETMECVDLCKRSFYHYGAEWYPDPENPQLISTFKKHGFNCIDFSKKKGTVLAGIEAIRAKLNPGPDAEPQMFFLKGDPSIDGEEESLVEAMEKWAWKLSPAGEPTDIPAEKHKDQCFTSDTEVLTPSGWVSLKDITTEDEVLSITRNGVAYFEKPYRVIHQTYSGPMISIHKNHLKFSSTKGHAHSVISQFNWRVKKRWIFDKKTFDELPAESYWANSFKEIAEGPGLFEGGQDEAWVAGFWVAEGCFDRSNPTQILIDQKKEKHKKECRERLSRLGWSYFEKTRAQDRLMTRFCINSQRDRIVKWKEWFNHGAKNKKLNPGIVLQMTKTERRSFFDGYMAGDGSTTQSLWHFDSISRDLIDGIQFLALCLGYGCRVVTYDCMREDRPSTLKGKMHRSWRGHVLRSRPVCHIKKSSFFEWTAKDIEVHCVSVSTGIFLARTAGDVFVAGNCDALRYMVYNITPVRATTGNRGGRPTNEEVASRPKTLSEQFWDTMKSEGEPLFGLDMSERPDPYDTDPSSGRPSPKIRKRFF